MQNFIPLVPYAIFAFVFCLVVFPGFKRWWGDLVIGLVLIAFIWWAKLWKLL